MVFSLQYNIKVNTDFGTFISQLCYLLVVTLRNYLDSLSLSRPCLWTASIKLLQDNLLAWKLNLTSILLHRLTIDII